MLLLLSVIHEALEEGETVEVFETLDSKVIEDLESTIFCCTIRDRWMFILACLDFIYEYFMHFLSH